VYVYTLCVYTVFPLIESPGLYFRPGFYIFEEIRYVQLTAFWHSTIFWSTNLQVYVQSRCPSVFYHTQKQRNHQLKTFTLLNQW